MGEELDSKLKKDRQEILSFLEGGHMEKALLFSFAAVPFLVLGLVSCEQAPAQATGEARPRSDAALVAESAVLKRHPGDPVLNPAAAITLTLFEFSDYACSFSRKLAPQLSTLVDENPDVQVVFKAFPILGDESEVAARASVAAARQNGWRLFHTALMNSSPGLTVQQAVHAAAAAAQLDFDRLEKDMAASETTAAIDRNRRLAKTFGIDSTPTLVLVRSHGMSPVVRTGTEETLEELLKEGRLHNLIFGNAGSRQSDRPE